MTMREQVWQTIEAYRMLPPGEAVVVGVSGGADSMALLHLLLSLWRQEERAEKLLAVHVQHNLRGAESRADEAYVRQTCAEWGVELLVRSVDVAERAARQGTGLEETGRQVRYAVFEEIARAHAPCRIATAHNRKDNMETVLLHLTRGSGLQGGGGMAPVRGHIIRPLLFCSREEIEAYCAAQGIDYRQDSTNRDVAYSRNRIRQEVLPSLEHINPRAEEAFLRFSEAARQDEDCLRQLARQLTENAAEGEHDYRTAPLLAAHPALCVRALQEMARREACPALEAGHIRQLQALLGEEGSVVLPGNRRVVSRRGRLHFFPAEEEAMPVFPEEPVSIERCYEFCGKTYSFSILSLAEYEKQKKVNKILLKNAWDYAMIVHSLHWRSRRPGDCYRPAGRPTKTLKKLLNEAGIPAWERQALPVLCDDDGIVWTAFGCAERVAVTTGTTQVLLITVTQDDKNNG